MPLEKKVAIVTGATGGIGFEISRKLVSSGYNLHISYLGNEKRYEELKSELVRQNVTLSATKGNIRDSATCGKIISDCVEFHQRIDAVILNAGIFKAGELPDIPENEWHNLVETNLSSAVYILKHAIPKLRVSRGSIIFLGSGSLSNPIPAPDYPLYEASKAGLFVLMKSLSVSEGKHGVRVNMVSPGLIDTGGYKPESMEKLTKEIPAGRFGNPIDVANAVDFLLGEKASYISGANIEVTGGWVRKY